jgi:hypothetical protein
VRLQSTPTANAVTPSTVHAKSLRSQRGWSVRMCMAVVIKILFRFPLRYGLPDGWS